VRVAKSTYRRSFQRDKESPMARRKNSVLQDLYAIAQRLPWKVSAALAIGCFLVLHTIASQEPATATSTKDIGTVALRHLFRMAAVIGQVIVPIILIAGEAAGFLAQRMALHAPIHPAQSAAIFVQAPNGPPRPSLIVSPMGSRSGTQD
jgi:hypothetical protein